MAIFLYDMKVLLLYHNRGIGEKFSLEDSYVESEDEERV